MDEIQEEIDLLREWIIICNNVNQYSEGCSPQQAAIVMERIVGRLEALKRISDHPASVDENLPLPL